MEIIARLESNVRYYSRCFPVVFATARGSTLVAEDGTEYLDFFSGAGALNYGHNPPSIKQKVIEYLERDGIVHGLDMATSAKCAFLSSFERTILRSRGLDYKVQFTAPTGADAVEAALKLARKVTGCQTIVAFAGAYHGVTLGALALTSNRAKRAAAGVPLNHVVTLPFDGDVSGEVDSLDCLEILVSHALSPNERPAAVILETIQAEGGVKVASREWLQRLASIAARTGMLLIVDDIQVGCGRAGTFFSFEPSEIVPDIVCLSKSLGGVGLPLSLLLVKPALDVWSPGDHVGTFRSNNLSLIAATEALTWWQDETFARSIEHKSQMVRKRLEQMRVRHPVAIDGVRGRGLIYGLVFKDGATATKVASEAFDRRLLIEAVGRDHHVLKVLPPLTIPDFELEHGLTLIEQSIEAVSARVRSPFLQQNAEVSA